MTASQSRHFKHKHFYHNKFCTEHIKINELLISMHCFLHANDLLQVQVTSPIIQNLYRPRRQQRSRKYIIKGSKKQIPT